MATIFNNNNKPNNNKPNNNNNNDDDDYAASIEAHFRLRLFALLRSSDSLGQLLSAMDLPECSQLRLELGRFLAAYYLNFSLSALFANIRTLKEEGIIMGHDGDGGCCCILPNLLLWSELDEQWRRTSKGTNGRGIREGEGSGSGGNVNIWDGPQIGQFLSTECSPKLAILLLLRERRILEAIFLADNFNDFRTALALRFLADRSGFSLNLFPEYCHQTIIDGLLKAIESSESNGFECDANLNADEYSQTMGKLICNYIEAALHLDVLYGPMDNLGLLDSLMAECSLMMATYFLQLVFGQNDDSAGEGMPMAMENGILKGIGQMLPRPPIYAAQLSNGETRSSFAAVGGGDTDLESIGPSVLHRCYLAISNCLGRTNRLEPLIGFFALWLARSQNSAQDDLPQQLLESQFFFGQTNEELRRDLTAFQTMISVVIGMETRDKLIRLMAAQKGEEGEHDHGEKIEKCQQKLNILVEPFKLAQQQGKGKGTNDYEEEYNVEGGGGGLVWRSLKKWALLADQEDLDRIGLFLHTLQQTNQQKRGFLPPLNAQNRPKWYSLQMAEANGPKDKGMNGTNTNLNVFARKELRYRLSQPDLLRLHYLAFHFPSIPLNGQGQQTIIQMRIQLDPDEFCLPIEEEPKGAGRRNVQLVGVFDTFRTNAKMPIMFGRGDLGKAEDEGGQQKGMPMPMRAERGAKSKEDEDLEELTEQIRASIKRLEMMKGEEDEVEEEVAEEVEEEEQNEEEATENGLKMMETSSENQRERKEVRQNGQKRFKRRRIRRKSQWHSSSNSRSGRQQEEEEAEKPTAASSSSTSMEKMRTRTYAAFLRAKLRRDGLLEEEANSHSTAISSSFSTSLPSFGRSKLRGGRRGGGGGVEEAETSEKESAFESMPEGDGEEEEEEAQEDEIFAENDDNLLMREMEEIGQKLQRIWEKFERRKEAKKGGGAEEEKEEAAEDMMRKEGRKGMEDMDVIGWIEDEENAKIDEKKQTEGKQEQKNISKMEKELETHEGDEEEKRRQKEIEEKLRMPSTSAARQPNSAGYHSSISSSESEEARRIRSQLEEGKRQSQKEEELLRPMLPMKIQMQPMDFSRLSKSESEEEEEGQEEGEDDAKLEDGIGKMKKKKKRTQLTRKWSEIEVFPRNDPAPEDSLMNDQPAEADQIIYRSAEKVEKQQQPKKLKEKKKKRQWKAPQWLRLLPPFDGAIRTERPSNSAAAASFGNWPTTQRPLLQLKLEGLETLSSANIGTPRRRTFLDMAKKESMRKRKMEKTTKIAGKEASLGMTKTMANANANMVTGPIGVYDSGIGLDNPTTVTTHFGTNQFFRPSNDGIVLYSAELGPEEIAEMRRRAKKLVG